MGLSFWHLIIIVFIVLLLFGPNRLPQLGKSLGEAIRGFKKGIGDSEIDVTDCTRRDQIRGDDTTTTQTQKEANKDKV